MSHSPTRMLSGRAERLVGIAFRLAQAQRDHRGVRDREREHRAERVEVAEERDALAAGDLGGADHADRRERVDDDRDPGRAPGRVDRAQEVGELPVHAHRVRQARDADQPGVRGDDQDRAREQADVVAHGRRQRPEAEVLDDALHRVACVLGAERRRVVRALGARRVRQRRRLVHRHRRERDRRQERVDREHRRGHEADRARHVARRGRAPPPPCSRSSRCPCRRPCRSGSRSGTPRRVGVGAEVHVARRAPAGQDQRGADDHEQRLRGEVGEREEDVEPRRLLDAADVEQRRARCRGRPRRPAAPSARCA